MGFELGVDITNTIPVELSSGNYLSEPTKVFDSSIELDPEEVELASSCLAAASKNFYSGFLLDDPTAEVSGIPYVRLDFEKTLTIGVVVRLGALPYYPGDDAVEIVFEQISRQKRQKILSIP